MIPVKDSGSNIAQLKTSLVAGEHIPHHNVDSSALPAGASTEAKQTTIVSLLQAQATKLESQPVAIVSGLPANPATSVNQDTMISTLASLLAELSNKANLGETQPVNVLISALPAGAATDGTLDAVRALLDLRTPVSGKTADITNTTATTVIAAPGSGHQLGIVSLYLANSHATVGTWVNITDGSTTLGTVYLAALGGRAELIWPVQVPLLIGDNLPLRVVCETTGSNVRAWATGFTT